MPRLAFTMHLKKGYEKEYEKRHDDIWPELSSKLKDTGISNYYIYLDPKTLTLFATLDVTDESKLEDLPNQEIVKKWWSYMADIMDTYPDNSPIVNDLNQVFLLP
ncbi:MAG: L-rhamnose mutarotase [Planctomycetota bacterium]|nr:MAG: L-rhamnose mutarotase [Planctomycetota bacterium]